MDHETFKQLFPRPSDEDILRDAAEEVCDAAQRRCRHEWGMPTTESVETGVHGCRFMRIHECTLCGKQEEVDETPPNPAVWDGLSEP